MNKIFKNSIYFIFFLFDQISANYKFLYFNSNEYLKKNRFSKQNILWKHSTLNKKMFLPSEDLIRELKQHSNENKRVTFIYRVVGDAIPFQLKKGVHNQGLIAKCVLIPEKNNTYTGIFNGSDTGIMRVSFDSVPNLAHLNYPGLALKFFRDNMPSGNFLLVGSFKKFSNQKTPYLTKSKYDYLNLYISSLGLYNLSKYDKFGKLIEKNKYPYEIYFKNKENFDEKILLNEKDFIEKFENIELGTHLFNVFAIDNPQNRCKVKIGSVYLKSRFTTSFFADKNFFFNHCPRTKDIKFQPHWKNFIYFHFHKIIKKKCPFI